MDWYHQQMVMLPVHWEQLLLASRFDRHKAWQKQGEGICERVAKGEATRHKYTWRLPLESLAYQEHSNDNIDGEDICAGNMTLLRMMFAVAVAYLLLLRQLDHLTLDAIEPLLDAVGGN